MRFDNQRSAFFLMINLNMTCNFLSEDGELIWENGNLKKRMDAKFKNPPCLKCRIMPLCNGGCSQHAIENSGSDYCIFNGDEFE